MRLIYSMLVLVLLVGHGCHSVNPQPQFEVVVEDIEVQEPQQSKSISDPPVLDLSNLSSDPQINLVENSKLSSAFNYIVPSDDGVEDVSESELWSDCLSWEVDDNGEEYCNVYEER